MLSLWGIQPPIEKPPILDKPDPNQFELVEIELPLDPGIDWVFWIEVGTVIMLVLLVVMVLFWLRRLLWGSLKLQALTKLNIASLEKAGKDLSQLDIQSILAKINRQFQQAKRLHFLAEADEALLSARFNQALFSGQDVSRETATQLAENFIQALKIYQKAPKDVVLSLVDLAKVKLAKWVQSIKSGAK